MYTFIYIYIYFLFTYFQHRHHHHPHHRGGGVLYTPTTISLLPQLLPPPPPPLPPPPPPALPTPQGGGGWGGEGGGGCESWVIYIYIYTLVQFIYIYIYIRNCNDFHVTWNYSNLPSFFRYHSAKEVETFSLPAAFIRACDEDFCGTSEDEWTLGMLRLSPRCRDDWTTLLWLVTWGAHVEREKTWKKIRAKVPWSQHCDMFIFLTAVEKKLWLATRMSTQIRKSDWNLLVL